jgi:hypothetical protein
MVEYDKTCISCNKTYRAKRKHSQTCSEVCRANKNLKNRINLIKDKAIDVVVAPMVKTIKKQEVVIEKLENEVDTLESEILYYKKRHLEINKALKNTLFDHPVIYKQYSDKYLEIEKILHEKYNIK